MLCTQIPVRLKSFTHFGALLGRIELPDSFSFQVGTCIREQRCSIPVLSELWQLLKPIFDDTKDFAATLLLNRFVMQLTNGKLCVVT